MINVGVLRSHTCVHPFTARSPAVRRRDLRHVVQCAAQTKQPKYHISMCTNVTCKKQGCQQVIQFAQDLALDEIEIETCGCLGICGNGPNIVVDPPGTQLSHVSSASKFVEVLDLFCNLEVPDKYLKATELRLQGNSEARSGDLKAAEAAYTRGIELDLPKGSHMLYANRSGVRLTLGNSEGALEDANAALKFGPPTFTTAFIRKIAVLCSMKRRDEAAEALEALAEQDKAFARSKDFKSLVKQVQAIR